MVSAEQSNHAKAYLRKAEEYMESAEDNLELERYTPAAGDSIHAGISAKDANVTSLVETTSKSKNHAAAVKELGRVEGVRRIRRAVGSAPSSVRRAGSPEPRRGVPAQRRGTSLRPPRARPLEGGWT